MAIVENAGQLLNIRHLAPLQSTLSGAIRLFDDRQLDYADLYKTQHEVRTVIDFLARNISQVPLHAYRRVSDTSRERITGAAITDTLDKPDYYTTRSRWMEALVKDLCIFDEAIRIKVRGENGRIVLVRVPPTAVKPIGTNWLRPEGYEIIGYGKTVEFTRDEVIHLHGYDPKDPRKGLSPLETLRQLLSEQFAAAEHREGLWKQGARASLVIERPLGAPPWSDTARSRFKADWDSSYTGSRNSGKTAILEEGMIAKPLETFSPRDSQYIESMQLAREVVAAAYGVPTGLLGLGNSTYASLSEQNRQLYQNALAPWLTLIQEELEAQLLTDFDEEDAYLEFNLADKLKGSFEEQATVLQASVGAPYLTRNEARARLNLPALEGADELVVPLNVLVGGQASPQDSVSTDRQLGLSSAELSGAKSAEFKARKNNTIQIRNEQAEAMKKVYKRNIERQKRSVLSKYGAKKSLIKNQKAISDEELDDIYDLERFDKELADDIYPVMRNTAIKAAKTVGEWNPGEGEDWLREVSKTNAKLTNESIRKQIEDVINEIDLEEEFAEDALADDLGIMFDEMLDNEDSIKGSYSMSTMGINFGRNESARTNNRSNKTWTTTSGSPRSSHALLDGETVGITENFSNGVPFPGHPALGPEEVANCQCICDFGD